MKKLVIALACVAALAGSAAVQAANVLPAGTNLNKGERIVSKNGLYHLIMQDDGNLVLYFGLFNPLKSIWWTSTRSRGWYARMQEDGNFVVYSDHAEWDARYGGHSWNPNYKLTVGDDGIVAIRSAADSNGGPALVLLAEDKGSPNGGPAYAFPVHSWATGRCVDSLTYPAQSGFEARNIAFNSGRQLGRCADNVNVYGY